MSFMCSFNEMANMERKKKVIHSIKAGISLVLISLLYLLDHTFKQVGENAMWAIMTVVVAFEFYTGATISKSINRGIGTILGGGLGYCAAILVDTKQEVFEGVVVGCSVFIIGAGATYMRLIPQIKRRFDYAMMIFILTFNLVIVTPVHSENIKELVLDRLSTIAMGLVICMCVSMFIFPIWASDELHFSISSKFEKLASGIDGCIEELCGTSCDMQNLPNNIVQACKSLLHSKANEESLANFARWEPWHGKFGFSYPWKQYLKIGEVLRELAAIVFTLHGYLISSEKTSSVVMSHESMKELESEIVMLSIGWILRELGESVKKMKRCRASYVLTPKLHSMKMQSSLMCPSNNSMIPNAEKLEITCSSLLMEIVEKMDALVKEVDGLGELANFQTMILDV